MKRLAESLHLSPMFVAISSPATTPQVSQRRNNVNCGGVAIPRIEWFTHINHQMVFDPQIRMQKHRKLLLRPASGPAITS